jgi:peptidoglycan/xylan/chitin deacetylase (PgdA/CDA1 family)
MWFGPMTIGSESKAIDGQLPLRLLRPPSGGKGQARRQTPDHGALVISLDFELLWGVRDLYPPDGGAYRANLLGSRQVIPQLLDLFEQYDVAATWAAVGMLFATSRDELQRFQPAIQPDYDDARLFPYNQPLGVNEAADPLHFARTLIDAIRARPKQEIATHTFSHLYCLEPGCSRAAFAADLASASAIAAHCGVRLRSIVFPRNQYNPAFDDLLIRAGISTYRGTERHPIHRATRTAEYNRVYRRGGRMLDTYVGLSGSNLTSWTDVPQANGLCNVPASCFLRPVIPRLRRLERLRLRRIGRAIEQAAISGGIFHLWWHPHNFGVQQNDNLTFLRHVLDIYVRCRTQYGMQSFSMAGIAEAVGCL